MPPTDDAMAANSTSKRPHILAEKPLPPDGDSVVCIIVCSIALIFLGIAAYNLWHFRTTSTTSVVASILWTTLVTAASLLFLWDAGSLRQSIVNFLSTFSRRHFIQAMASDGGVTICIGFRLFGQDFHVVKIDGNTIVSLDWRTGQATSMHGRDMDDWHVTLWYDRPAGSPSTAIPGYRDEELVCIGPQRARSETEVFGKSLVEFLVAVGVELLPGDGETEFVAKSRLAD